MRKPSPISTSSPRLTMISRPRASASAQSSSAAALLLTTRAASASGTAAASASSAPRPRRARLPVASSNSTSVAPAATRSASRAAADSGARPRLVWTMTPVALITCRRLVAYAGRAAMAAAVTSSGLISPRRARSWAPVMAALTRLPAQPVGGGGELGHGRAGCRCRGCAGVRRCCRGAMMDRWASQPSLPIKVR